MNLIINIAQEFILLKIRVELVKRVYVWGQRWSGAVGRIQSTKEFKEYFQLNEETCYAINQS